MASKALLLLGLIVAPIGADITIINKPVDPDAIYDTIILKDSDHRKELSKTENRTKYYCLVRNLWTKESTPFKYPAMAGWSSHVLYSGTLQYKPWEIERQTTKGVEKMAETGHIDDYREAVEGQRELVKDIGLGKKYILDEFDNNKNIVFMDGVTVDEEYAFLSGMAGILPSPDWYSGFYLLDTIDKFDFTFWERIQIRTYPWDAGTDGGDTYRSLDRDLFPPQNVERIRKGNTRVREGIFLDKDRTYVPPVQEWDCMLHVCPNMDDCDKPNWPPPNECDIFKYPGCDKRCDPDNPEDPEVGCQQCKPKNIIEQKSGEPIFYKDCCESQYEPLQGRCENVGEGGGSSGVRLIASTASLFAVLACMIAAV